MQDLTPKGSAVHSQVLEEAEIASSAAARDPVPAGPLRGRSPRRDAEGATVFDLGEYGHAGEVTRVHERSRDDQDRVPDRRSVAATDRSTRCTGKIIVTPKRRARARALRRD